MSMMFAIKKTIQSIRTISYPTMLMAFIVLLAACIQQPSTKRTSRSSASTGVQSANTLDSVDYSKVSFTDTANCVPPFTNCHEYPSAAADGTTGLGTTYAEIYAQGEPELNFLVDPVDGSYSRKVTIHQNYRGPLYVSGLNIGSLSNRLVDVRFNFGFDSSPVTIPAIIGTGVGITPQSNVSVLILNIDDKYNFDNIRLLYDLFDYNDYDEEGASPKDPTQDPLDAGLYCRALKLEHDSTWVDTDSDGKCASSGEICKYAYAKIKDRALVKADGTSMEPSRPQIDEVLDSTAYSSLSVSDSIKKCLPDNNNVTNLAEVLNGTPTASGAGPTMDYGDPVTLSDGTTSYTYHGPYYPLATSIWQIEGDALISDTAAGATPSSGIFQKSLATATPTYGGYKSFLFPRATKVELQAGIQHFSASSAYATSRSITSLNLSGESSWMDGCNARVRSFDEHTGNKISSCNVTATVEIVTTDITTNETIVLGESAKELKLQLVRESDTNYLGQELLSPSMNLCDNSRSCAADECCYAGRCWANTLVSECIDEGSVSGNLGVGEVCSTDLECASFCCANGICKPHVNNDHDQVFCSKAPGQSCLGKEMCRIDYVPTCKIYKTGTDITTGKVTCALLCDYVPTHGNCINGVCHSPSAPDIPEFDPSDCSQAIDRPM